MMTDLAEQHKKMNEFRTKVIDKVKADIADLLPPEAVGDLVDQAVRVVFFEPRVVDHGKYGSPDTMGPSWFEEAVAKQAKPILEEWVTAFVSDRQDDIKRAFDRFLEDQNLSLMMCAAMASHLVPLIADAAGDLNARIKAGY